MEKYSTNKFVLRMNEKGKNCYFLISGKLSVLKPVEYKNINISYNDYLIYLMKLYDNDEFDLLKKVLYINNKNFLTFHNLEKILKNNGQIIIFIKSYAITKLNFKIKNNLIDFKDIHKIKKELEEFNINLLDYNVDENEIEENIEKISSNKSEKDPEAIRNEIKNYMLQIFHPSEDDIFNMLPYEFLLNEISKTNKNNNKTATLYKYDLFLYLYPGAFFGETALEAVSNHKRNASIRTEEDCNIISLNQRLYNSILYESTKMIKDYDIQFLRKKYFFENIPSSIFNRLYFPMFKLVSKNKNDLIIQQNTDLKSVYFLKEGEIKFEIYMSAIDIFKSIKNLIDCIISNKKILKISEEQITELEINYLIDEDLIFDSNKSQVFNEKINELKKYEIYSTSNYESIGILEFFSSMNKYNTSCYITSQNAKFFEINIENLNKILKLEKDIQKDYYKLIKNKILIKIKRLYYLKLNFLSNFKYKIKKNFNLIKNKNDYNNEININIDSYLNNKLNISNIIKNIKNEDTINQSDTQFTFINNLSNTNIINDTQSILNLSPKYIKLKKPFKNKLTKDYIEHFNIEFENNKNWSPVSLRSTKYNEKYFFNKKLDKKNNSNNENKIHLNNTDIKNNYNDILKTLIIQEPKKNNSEKNPLKFKINKLNINKMINIGNNHIFSLGQLKTKLKKTNISKSMLNLSIVKNGINNFTNITQNYNNSFFNKKYNNSKPKSFLYYKNNSLANIRMMRLKRIKIFKNEISNNISNKNTLCSTNNNNILINYIKINDQNKKNELVKLYNHKYIINKSNNNRIIKRKIV